MRKGGIAKVSDVGGIKAIDFCHYILRHSTIINFSVKAIDVSPLILLDKMPRVKWST